MRMHASKSGTAFSYLYFLILHDVDGFGKPAQVMHARLLECGNQDQASANWQLWIPADFCNNYTEET